MLLIVTQLSQTVPVNVDYLFQLDQLVENIKINYTDRTTTDTKHDLTECYYPNLSYISVESSALLL